ncbi:hypothetical protein KY290_000628 [Solanum tuberosum]|uniref:Uncharacterized protein n=1 Tax=Solanum tuberosum TaxID=4113 RepID=A0ABQ7WJW8_SOLTU|nr:hypothetical protein KY289_000697 [Solanum tuberosum]KAH0781030.1 hypothetical protein KY290_000628 [Solanum tuberosum]
MQTYDEDDAANALDQDLPFDSPSQPAEPSNTCVESPMHDTDELEALRDDPPAHDPVESMQTIPMPANNVIHTIGSRKTTKTCKPSVWIKYYIVPNKSSPHEITNHVCHVNVSTGYQSYLHAFSATVEPKSFNEASKDKL